MKQTSPPSRACRSGSFWLGLCCGAAIGAGAALLVAPQSGQHTRQKILKQIQQQRQHTQQLSQNGGQQAQQMFSTLQQQVRSKWLLFKEALLAGKKAAQETHAILEQSEPKELNHG